MTQVIVLGAGIAGLSCARHLKQRGVDVLVLEKQPYVGGLARSFDWHGFSCDFAAHRLFSRDEAALEQLTALVPMHEHARRSQIYFNGKWMNDPLDIGQLLLSDNPWRGWRIVRDYFGRPRQLPDSSFANYVIGRYGHELYDYFFRPYTEKLFGINGADISVSWARTKVRLASPFDRFKTSTKKKFKSFYYPKVGGYGAICDTMAAELGDCVRLNSLITDLWHDGEQITQVVVTQNGQRELLSADFVISTLPLTVTGRLLGHPVDLDYRGVNAVYLWLNKRFASPNHWLYFMDDDIVINRMVEFKQLSATDKPADTTVVCAEVTRDVDNPVEQVIADLCRIGFVTPDEILDAMVHFERFAYPVYRAEYETTVGQTTQALAQWHNLRLVGRAAEFKHREADDNFAEATRVAQAVYTALQQRPATASTTQLDHPA